MPDRIPAPAARALTAPAVLAPVAIVLTFVTAGCFGPAPSSGGGQTAFSGTRRVNAADVLVPKGYRVEAVATGLTFPTGVAFDAAGRVYVVEAGYSYGEVWATPRLLRVEPDGNHAVVATGENPPWNGVDYRDGVFYVAEGGHRGGGRILAVGNGQRTKVLADKLPSLGDHHTNGPVVGPDGWVYFGQGTATNSGVVGPDAARFGWLYRHPDFHDVPAKDVKLTGRNFTGDNPLTRNADDAVTTGAFSPFGTPTREGQIIQGATPCTGAVMRVRPGDHALEVVAWGLRNPYGLAFSPDGTLYVTENSYDVRGSRPVWGAGDLLWAIQPGLWYGWPDFHGGLPLSDPDDFSPPGEKSPQPLLAEHPNPPPEPAAKLGVHGSANGIDFSRNPAFGHAGEAFIAEFGDMAPAVGKVLSPVGFQVVRVDVGTGVVHTFAANKGEKTGPASKTGGAGFERPTAVKFDPEGAALYVVDFGVMTITEAGPHPVVGTGVLWRISREGGR